MYPYLSFINNPDLHNTDYWLIHNTNYWLIYLICTCYVCYLQVAEIVQSMEELVEFTKSLSPGISNMTRQVDGRREDLTNASHAAMLEEETDQVMIS